MTGELEAAAADSLRDFVKGARGLKPTPGQTCANCGAPLQGAYCHVCGQNIDTHQRSITRLCWEAIKSFLDLDGRLVRTLPALFFQPGRLTRDYMEGRIARHVPPFRTFLVALVLFVFAAQHATHELTLEGARKKAAENAALATPQGRAVAAAKRRADAAQDLNEAMSDAAKERADELKDPDEKPDKVAAVYASAATRAQARYAAALQRADRVAQGLPAKTASDAAASTSKNARKRWWKTGLQKASDNPDAYWAVLFTWGQRLAILLLPTVGLSLALVYRKRKAIFIYDHLLVAMNLMSFSFLTNGLGLVLPFSWMPYWFGFVALWTPINLFQTLRGAYDSSVLGATLKTLVVWSMTVFAFSLLLVGLLVLAVAEV